MFNPELQLPELFTPPMLAKFIGISEAGIRAMCRNGEIPAKHVRRQWVINKKEFMVAWFPDDNKRQYTGKGKQSLTGSSLKIAMGL